MRRKQSVKHRKSSEGSEPVSKNSGKPISMAAPRLPHDQPNGKPNASNRPSQNLQFCHRRIKSFAMMARN
jgi:hypothetical protein